MSRSRRADACLKWVERVLLAGGVALLGWCAFIVVDTRVSQASASRALEALPAIGPAVAARGPSPPEPAPPPTPGTLVGRLEIRRLKIDAVVREGTDATTLRRAVGRISSTAMPGTTGNVGLAAHRDTFFRTLKDVRPDDEILLTTPRGEFRYVVRGTKVVEPSDTWVLDPTPRPGMTLVTCYPFHFIGAAPHRFIVRADQVERGRAEARPID